MKYLILIGLATICHLCVAQKTLLVRPVFQPNTSYLMTTVSRDSSQVNVTGSEESLERFKATGRRLQETSLTTLNYQIAAIIRARRPDGSLPIEMIFFPDTSNIIYGSKTQKDIGTEARLFGSYSAEMMISIDSITGK